MGWGRHQGEPEGLRWAIAPWQLGTLQPGELREVPCSQNVQSCSSCCGLAEAEAGAIVAACRRQAATASRNSRNIRAKSSIR